MDEFAQAKTLIDKSENILIMAHKRPDGDTLGCACAFSLMLTSIGKSCTLACIDVPSDRFGFLPEVKKFTKEFNPSAYDLVILPDIADVKMVSYELPDGVPVILIDHHASNNGIAGAINLIDEKAASASVIVYKFFQFMGVKITSHIATCLLTGIYNDTGSFMHSNTSNEVFKISSELTFAGAKMQVIIKNMFRNVPISTLKLWGKALEALRVNKDNVAISVLTKKDFEDCDALPSESGGIIEKMSSIPGIKFAILLHETATTVKGSMRTVRDDVDLVKVAELFGGGGHKKAAGFTLPGRIEREVRWKVVPESGFDKLNDISPINGLFIDSNLG
ncbi:MAG: MgpA protein, phosphoesterase RecJ domain-containing protein [Candidatus Peregrinibacteria bacterium GW2011_GWF2_38_29]|nr:MAG: MgpA protein, phosphoesterase RecJ domain-containing protein [Candidatus Peregrinibacteria bacterium GW2011_GWF2_38_29]HBB02999.1 hypothetical protein [Candidatus Peregrinibacteria bacterium]